MKRKVISRIAIALADFILAALVFRYFRVRGGILDSKNLDIALALLWMALGFTTNKLHFDGFRKIRYGIFNIAWNDVIVFLVIYFLMFHPDLQFVIGERLYGTPGPDIKFVAIVPLIAGEFLLFLVFSRFMVLSLPTYYEGQPADTDGRDSSIDIGAKLYTAPVVEDAVAPKSSASIAPEILAQVTFLHDSIAHMGWPAARQYIESHREQFPSVTFLNTLTLREIDDLPAYAPCDAILCLERLNNSRQLNRALSHINSRLSSNGLVLFHAITSRTRRDMLFAATPLGLRHITWGADYIWSRVFPKLRSTRKLYFRITDGEDRNLPRVEILGRICRAGFTIVNEEMRMGEYYVTALRTSEPIRRDDPNYGPLIKLRRYGKDGKEINVYKFRSMYAYSEYLQSYTYGLVGLQDGGKLKDDFRVTRYGRITRRYWIDELPMIYNLLRGDIKLVGVRPLSPHYFSLYTPEMQQLHTKVKPGLIPPFYAEKTTPVTIEDVQESERRYIESYLKAPLSTDLRYLGAALKNILIKREHSN